MKTEEELLKWLREMEADERIHYKPADAFTNAPLALVQTVLEITSDVLRRILGMPLCNHGPNGKWEPMEEKK